MSDCIDRLIALTAKKRRIDSDLKGIKEEIATVEAVVAQELRNAGTQRLTRNGTTVYVQRNISVRSKGGDTAAIVDKLRRARHGELIGVNWQRLKAWVKERMRRDDLGGDYEIDMSKLPPTIREVVEIEEYQRIGVRQG